MSMRAFARISLVAGALVWTPVVASAADPTPAYRGAPLASVIYNWTGFYVGGHIGVGIGGGDNSDAGFLGGGQAGFNYQAGPWVYGVEGQFSGTSIKDSVSASFFVPGAGVGFAHAEARLDWVSTLAVRAGWAFDRWLVYGKVGGAWAHVSADAVAGMAGLAAAVSVDTTSSGWMVGLGSEYALQGNWTAKFEYNMLDFGNDLDGTVHVFK